MPPTLDDLYASPDHYLHSFAGDDAVFVRMDRAAYRRSIFLDARISPAAPGAMRVPLALLPGSRGEAPRTGWIFHIAHCGSTLLARALDELGSNLVLREPLALRQLGVAPDPARLALALGMLAKRYPGAGPTLVKANVPVNFLLEPIAAADPAAAAVLLHYGLRDYLLAILRGDSHRRWLRGVTAELAWSLGDLAELSDAECAAALWLAQMRRFAGLLDAMPQARTLDAEELFADPAAVLALVAERFGIEPRADAIAGLVAGPLFATYSKNPEVAFDNAARLARRSEIEAMLASEIAAAERWLEPHREIAADALAVIESRALG